MATTPDQEFKAKADAFFGPKDADWKRLRRLDFHKVATDAAGGDADLGAQALGKLAAPSALTHMASELSSGTPPGVVAFRHAARHLATLRNPVRRPDPAPTPTGTGSDVGKIPIPIKLRPTTGQNTNEVFMPQGTPTPARLWVYRGDAGKWLDDFARTADQKMIDQLHFAVAKHPDGRDVLVLKARQSPDTKFLPDKTHGMVEMAPDRRLRHLHVPVGTAVTPTPRTDRMRELLAPDPLRTTWLYPEAGGAFSTESMHNDSFRPMSDFVDYAHADAKHHEGWRGGADPFGFEPFAERGERPYPVQTPVERPQPPAPPKPPKRPKAVPGVPAPATKAPTREQVTPPDVSREQLFKRKADLEKTLGATGSPPESPEHARAWVDLARTESSLGDKSQASVAYQHSLWSGAGDPAELSREWAASSGAPDPAKTLGRDLAEPNPNVADADRVAASVVALAHDPDGRKVLAEHAPNVQRYLEAHDHKMGLRASWLANAAAHGATGDVLGMARVLDRTKARLAEHGLRPGYDLPDFVTKMGGPGADSGQALADLHPEISKWLDRAAAHAYPNPAGKGTLSAPVGHTKNLADLMTAYHLAQAGNMTAAKTLFERAKDARGDSPESEHFYKVLRYRVGQALRGENVASSLPQEIAESRKKAVEGRGGQVVRAFDQATSITNPAARRFASASLPLQSQMEALAHTTDRGKVAEIMKSLGESLRESPNDFKRYDTLRALAFGLSRDPSPANFQAVVPRLMEAAATPPSIPANSTPMGYMVGQAVRTLAEMDRGAEAVGVIDAFADAMARLPPTNAADGVNGAIDQWASLFRKGGIKNQGEAAVDKLARVVTRGLSPEGLRGAIAAAAGNNRSAFVNEYPKTLAAVLKVAETWIGLGDEAKAGPWLEAAERELPLLDDPNNRIPRQQLMSAYAAAVSRLGSKRQAAARIADTLGKLPLTNPHDTGMLSSNQKPTFWKEHLPVIDAIGRGMAADGRGLGKAGADWAGDDEYLFRRRMFGDFEAAKKSSGV